MPQTTRPVEILRSGSMACAGCGLALGMRMVLRAMGPRTVVVVVPSCVAVTSGPFPYAALGVPAFHSAFEIAAPTAAGISAALKALGKKDIHVLAFAGDGGTFDIGLQSLSGAADRNEDFIYVCMDNEAYMNTGIQVSSATPRYTWTGTTPTGNTRRKKQIMEIMAAHRMPYAATASIAFPEDLTAKIQKAKKLTGTRFIHMLSPCNTGWRIGEDMAVKVAMLSVETNVFPLYEIEDGLKFTINHVSRNLPVEKYLMLQGRYRHLKKEHIEAIQAETDRAWALLQGKAAGQAR
ncbi:MAG: 2-ketoisovalerate ferredoxin oxidoreductase [Deltaproteobacteria bacterium RBG_13_52_11]|nr:MAG: 2-ketoisovalerate ferredoxin oxidoreductase [Deltaproteobacteria bacterium RBG_13_52_11]